MSPIIATFFGIIVRLQFELGGKHHLPHVHAEYQEDEISIDFDMKNLIQHPLFKPLKEKVFLI